MPNGEAHSKTADVLLYRENAPTFLKHIMTFTYAVASAAVAGTIVYMDLQSDVEAAERKASSAFESINGNRREISQIKDKVDDVKTNQAVIINRLDNSETTRQEFRARIEGVLQRVEESQRERRSR